MATKSKKVRYTGRHFNSWTREQVAAWLEQIEDKVWGPKEESKLGEPLAIFALRP